MAFTKLHFFAGKGFHADPQCQVSAFQASQTLDVLTGSSKEGAWPVVKIIGRRPNSSIIETAEGLQHNVFRIY